MSDCINYVVDNYEHNGERCFYIATRIAGPGAPCDLEESYTVGCLCVGNSCLADTCPCQQYGRNYEYKNDRKKLEVGVLENSRPVGECHSSCRCVEEVELNFCSGGSKSEILLNKCVNRYVQFGPTSDLIIFDTLCKGLGLKTAKPILQYEYICEYAGEVLNEVEANNRIKHNKVNGLMNYVFILYEHMGDNKIVTCIDPSTFGNIGRYINHSCSPNAVIVPVRISSVIPHLAIFALKDILCGEEITFDYSGGEANGNKEKSDIRCFCGADKCRGWLPGVSSLSK